ncbi:MAG: TlpA disulfide reductase family protein [Anaerovorax sp.]|nr:TlpA disulfide reductase family protein [Anaerovorax sp.]
MKKVFKIIGITVASLVGIFIVLIIAFLIKGPSDVIILTPEEQAQKDREQTEIYANVDLSGFKTTTVTGETVTAEDCFKDYKITMVNIWVTNCSPCIAEMPDIAELYDNRPENSNIISICLDTADDTKDAEFAAEVMRDAEANFMTLIPDERIQEVLEEKTTIFPTTIFVDSNGKVVGAPHFGGRTEEDYRQAILERMKLIDTAGNEVHNE